MDSQFKLFTRFIALGFVAAFLLMAAPCWAQTTQPQFALAKNICTGNASQILAAGTGQNPASCPLASTVVAGTPAYYVITVTNPWGQPAQQISLNDALPSGFTQNGAIVCRDDASPTPNTINLGTGGGANSIGSIQLAIGATMNCFIQGSFSSPAPNTNATRVNTVTANNGGTTPFNMTAAVNTTVLPSIPLAADLSVVKTSSAPINIANGAASVVYTIVIKNNGPIDVDVADYFTLQDSFSLPTNGVPLNVEYLSSSCSATTGTSCLAAAGPNFTGATPLFVGPNGQTNFFSWGFDAGNGMIKNGGEITLTITVNVSQVTGIACVAALNANGLVNQTFFTLANQTSAYTEINPTNNTSTVTTAVTTGHATVDPDCGKGHLKFKKVQISPPAGTIVPWGTKVTYAITIENTSIPDQKIVINAGDLQDWVTQGLNTPPFTRRHVSTTCVISTDPNLCASFNTGINLEPDYKYKYYGETNKAWATNQAMILSLADSVTFNTTFVYERPVCETVPNAKTRPIINTASLSYMASALGAADPSVQDQLFNLQASAQTDMEKVDPCSFLVTKKIVSKTPRVQFGTQISYDISYTNNGAPQTVGTLLDVVRLSIPNYASSVPYASNWTCTSSTGVTGAAMSGSISGSATYTASPAQGSPAANFGSNIFFPTGGTLICSVSITVNRPAPNDPFCTQDKAEFENLALMDVTSPFNSNIAWPPSSIYNAASTSNPTPQLVNWAAVKMQLPACWDATVNKNATVVGLPSTSAPWTYVGGPAINYAITTTNKGQSNLGNLSPPPAQPQWLIDDNFTAPYFNANATAGTPLCVPTSPWCHSSAPLIPKSKIAIKTLAPLSKGVWNLQYTAPFVVGQPITNCANIAPEFGNEVSNFYQNTQPKPQPSCVTVPVVEVTAIKVTKTLVDNTGANVKIGGPFAMQVTCTPYAIPTSVVSAFSLSTNSAGTSLTETLSPIARSTNPLNVCTITETSAPIPPASALKCGGAGNVDVIAEYQYGSSAWQAMPAILNNLNSQTTGNNVMVRNTLKCKPGMLNVTKVVAGPTPTAQYVAIAQNYVINAACTPTGTPTSLTLNAGVASASGTIAAPTNSICNINETPPLLHQNMKDYCTSLGQVAAWDPIIYSPSSPITVTPGSTAVTVTNTWKCNPKLPTIQKVIKILGPGPGGVQLTGLQFTVQASCTPTASTPLSVTGTSIVAQPGASIGTFTIPAGSSCNFSEPAATMPLFPQAAITQCGANSHPEWNTPTFVKSATAASTALIVTNSWSCVPNTPSAVQLEIIKQVTGPVIPGLFVPKAPMQAYLFGAPCLNSTAIVNASGLANGSGLFNVIPNASCLLSEVQPAMDPALTAHCLAHGGGTAVWDAPTYSPSNNPTMTNGVNTVTVTNNWKCTTPASMFHVHKKLGPGPGGVQLTGLQFTIQSNCTPTASTTASVTGTSLPSSVNFPNGNLIGLVTVPAGSSCAFSEQAMPLFPQTAITQCGANSDPAWSTPTFVASPLVMTVTNAWTCVPKLPGGSQLTINKIVTGPAPTVILPPTAPMQAYQFTGSCLSNQATVSASGTTSGSGVFNVAANSATCTLSEAVPSMPALLSNYCATLGQVAAWDTPSYNPSATIPIVSGNNAVTVTNNWKCAPSLKIAKIVKGPIMPPTVTQPPTTPAQNYTITATCSGMANPFVFNLNASELVFAKDILAANLGSVCTVTETLPISTPAALSNYCSQLYNGNNGNPYVVEWKAPVYNPATPVTIQQYQGTGVSVTNEWKCVPPASSTATVQFYKVIQSPSGAPVGQLNWQANPYVFEVANGTPQTVSLPVSAGGVSAAYSAPITVAVGASLTVAEILPGFPTAATAYCASQGGKFPSWKQALIQKVVSSNPTVYAPMTLPVTMTAGVLKVSVTNSWECVATGAQGVGSINLRKVTPLQGSSQIELVKQITGPTSTISGLSFAITANCTPTLSQELFNITINHAGIGGTKIDVANNASCKFTQVRPPLPPAAQAFCVSRGFQQALWSPATTLFSAAAGQRLIMPDSWVCAGQLVKPPSPREPSILPAKMLEQSVIIKPDTVPDFAPAKRP